MGEKSRIIGEFGETTVENFLKLIGWQNASKNIELACLKDSKHEKRTHGIDFFFSYKSPLVDGLLKNVTCSVKFTSNPYPNSPGTKFKEHFEDLVAAIECFKYSPIKKEIVKTHKGYSQAEEVGVLFWLSNSSETYDDVISKVSNVQLNGDYVFDMLYVVDNKRIDFIYSAIRHSKSLFSKEAQVSFYYPDTGKNLIPTEKQNYGDILPVEYINSSILPFRVEEPVGNRVSLMLYTIDLFSGTDLKRLIGLAQDISKSWTGKIYICFPNYNELNHSDEVRIAKASFENKFITEKLYVVSYNQDFRSLQSK